jgi:hypothetical protein
MMINLVIKFLTDERDAAKALLRKERLDLTDKEIRSMEREIKYFTRVIKAIERDHFTEEDTE